MCMFTVASNQQLVLSLAMARAIPNLGDHIEELLLRPSLLHTLVVLGASFHVIVHIINLEELDFR